MKTDKSNSTDRGVTELKLPAEPAAFVDAIFGGASLGVGLISMDERMAHSNHALQALLGYSAEELSGLHVSAYTHPDDLDATRTVGQQLAAGERWRWNHEKRYVHKDGHEVWCQVTGTIIPETVVEGSYALVMIEDITPQKQAEEALRESAEYYKALFAFSLDGVLLTRIDGTILDANAAACEMLQMSVEEMRARGRANVLVPGPGVDEAVKERLEMGKVSSEVVFVRRDGTTFPAEFSSVVIPGTGPIPRSFVVFRDISKRRQAEEARRESHDLLAKLAARVPGVIYQFRLFPDGRIGFPWAGGRMTEVFGLSPDEVRDDAALLFDLVYPEDREQVREWIHESANTLEQFQHEFRVVASEEGVRWCRAEAVPERMEDGGALWHGMISDITSDRQMEQALRERDERLRQAQKMESIGRLAGGVAHDFNNLLTVILGYSDLLLADGEFAQSGWAMPAEQIRAAAERAGGLTQQILAFSRQQVLQIRLVSVNDLIQETLPLLRRTIGEHIEVEADLDPQVHLVEVDPGQFTQVLMNLALNARDAMPDGGRLLFRTENVTIDEEFRAVDSEAAPGAYVRTSVSDTGVGMDPEQIPLIFEPFYTTKGLATATGLGLATVYGIVKQSGGLVTVDSRLGEGTTFDVYLPCSATTPEAGARLDARVEPDQIGANILLVEDEEAVRHLTERLLTEMGHRVYAAASGPEALALLDSADVVVDLLITDVVMPGGMSGGDVARVVRTLRGSLPVLFVSGYSDAALLDVEDDDEAVYYPRKPFSARNLATRVQEALRGRER